MIRFDRVEVQYEDAAEPVLRDVDLHIPEGELCLVVGRTGAGKSTLLGAVNGLVPHFTGGTLRGRVTVDGRDTADHPPRELADVVGVVGQDPLAGFVTDTVEEELAYTMEQLALPPDVMRKRVEETLDLLGLADLRGRALHELSGGQQQRVAIGSVLTAHPRVLVLDEPTSALDPTAAEEVLAAVARLVHDLGVTVLLAEHRLERVVQYADRVVQLVGDGTVRYGPPAEVFGRPDAPAAPARPGPAPAVVASPAAAPSVVAPPVVRLGRLAGWHPLPLSVRDARRAAAPLRERLAGRAVPPVRTRPEPGATLLSARGVEVRHRRTPAVREVSLDLRAGEVTALMGRNGSGKSSLLWALQGSGPRQGGSVAVGADRRDPKRLSATEARRLVGLVPQTPTDLLYLETVAEELAQADAEFGFGFGFGSDAESGAGPGRAVAAQAAPGARGLLDRLAPGIADATHPRDLSEGQQLALVLAVQLAASPQVVLLDEPTRGLDYTAKEALIRIVDDLAAEGRTVVVSTHDVEFVASAADRVVVLAGGEVVADGPSAEVVVSSPTFAPQTAKILAPLPYLTVHQVAAALAGAEAER
ncbi:ABC transporter ATP-binding protein [Kitasatospora sp. NPDC054939]